MRFKNSFRCADGEAFGGRQIGVAETTIILNETTDVRYSMFGIAEAFYENMKLKVDGIEQDTVQAFPNGYCQVSTCRMCFVSRQDEVLRLGPGEHTIEISADTKDAAYHNECYFQMQFTKTECSEVTRTWLMP